MNVNEQHIRRIEKVSGSGHPKKEKAKLRKKINIDFFASCFHFYFFYTWFPVSVCQRSFFF